MLLQPSINNLFEQIGRRLYHIRRTRNEKLTAVAQEVGLSHGVISQIENGRYTGLSVKTLHVLANYYKVPLTDIMTPEEL